jgi:type II secretory pathway component GspD/PulD (secretin)
MPTHLRFALAVLALVAGTTTAQPPKPVEEKQYTVSFDKTPWPEVFKWFEKETGLTYIDTDLLKGTFTFKSDRKFTLPQVVDILNGALAERKLTIIRRSQTFLVHPIGERNPDMKPHFIDLQDLHLFGDTEEVQVIIPLNGVNSEDIAPQLKKLISSFGTASAYGSDQIIVLDKARNIRNIVHYLKHLDSGCGVFAFSCKFANANAAAHQLRRLLAERDPGGRPIEFGVDRFANSIRVFGPTDKQLFARELLNHIDVGSTPRGIGGKESWKVYRVAEGTADAYVRLMSGCDEFRDSGVHFLVLGASQLQAFGLPAEHAEIENFLKMPPAFWNEQHHAIRVTTPPSASRCR